MRNPHDAPIESSEQRGLLLYFTGDGLGNLGPLSSSLEQRGISTLINIVSMVDFDDNEDEIIVLDLIDDSIPSLPRVIALLAREILAFDTSRFFSHCFDSFQDAPVVLLWDRAQILRYGLLE